MQVGATGFKELLTENREAITKNSLSKDDFLKLLITELRYQDAMEPMNDREFMAQLAQMSSLEQMQNLNNTVEEGLLAVLETQENTQMGLATVLEVMYAQSCFQQGLNLLGREVSCFYEEQEVEGVVTALKQQNGGYVAVVNDFAIPLNQIKEVK